MSFTALLLPLRPHLTYYRYLAGGKKKSVQSFPPAALPGGTRCKYGTGRKTLARLGEQGLPASRSPPHWPGAALRSAQTRPTILGSTHILRSPELWTSISSCLLNIYIWLYHRHFKTSVSKAQLFIQLRDRITTYPGTQAKIMRAVLSSSFFLIPPHLSSSVIFPSCVSAVCLPVLPLLLPNTQIPHCHSEDRALRIALWDDCHHFLIPGSTLQNWLRYLSCSRSPCYCST